LAKRLSALTDRVGALEVQPPPDEEVHDGSNTDGLEDVVYDADGNVDQAATRQNRLRHRLCANTIGMGGTQHFNHHQGNRNCASNDPYAKVKFKIPSFWDIMMLGDTLIRR
jgi:hypothetical protein